MRRRGELVERSFAHGYDTGGMRRTHLKKHENILKRLLIHTAGFNLSLVLRQLLGLGPARGLQGLTAEALRRLAARAWGLWANLRAAAFASRPARLLAVLPPSHSASVTRSAA